MHPLHEIPYQTNQPHQPQIAIQGSENIPDNPP